MVTWNPCEAEGRCGLSRRRCTSGGRPGNGESLIRIGAKRLVLICLSFHREPRIDSSAPAPPPLNFPTPDSDTSANLSSSSGETHTTGTVICAHRRLIASLRIWPRQERAASWRGDSRHAKGIWAPAAIHAPVADSVRRCRRRKQKVRRLGRLKTSGKSLMTSLRVVVRLEAPGLFQLQQCWHSMPDLRLNQEE